MSQRTIAKRAAESERKRNELIENELRKKRSLVLEGVNNMLHQFSDITHVMQEAGINTAELKEQSKLWHGAYAHIWQITRLGVEESEAQLAQRRENEKKQYYQAATLLGICLE